MGNQKIQGRMQALADELNRYNYEYYVLAQPTVSDFEFDQRLKELQALEAAHPEWIAPNSPTQKIGGDITARFATVQHRWPMLSLSNTYNEDELRDFDKRVRRAIGDDFQYVCELKFDGLSISLTYENGTLIRAVTRGDGTQGDEVTANVRTIRSIPHSLRPSAANAKNLFDGGGTPYPELFEIRGEIFMHQAAFKRLNAARAEAGEQTYANPRNFASGTIKLQDSSEVARRPLDCFLYFFYADKRENLFKGHWESLQAVKSWGFPVSEHSASTSFHKWNGYTLKGATVPNMEHAALPDKSPATHFR